MEIRALKDQVIRLIEERNYNAAFASLNQIEMMGQGHNGMTLANMVSQNEVSNTGIIASTDPNTLLATQHNMLVNPNQN